MNAALEFHDCTVASVEREAGVLRIALEPAYVHRSAGRPGVDPGKGYLQPAELLFSEARVDIRGACIGDLSSGSVSCDGRAYDNVMPCHTISPGQFKVGLSSHRGACLRFGRLPSPVQARVTLAMSRNMRDNMSIDTDQQQNKAASPRDVVARSSSRCIA